MSQQTPANTENVFSRNKLSLRLFSPDPHFYLLFFSVSSLFTRFLSVPSFFFFFFSRSSNLHRRCRCSSSPHRRCSSHSSRRYCFSLFSLFFSFSLVPLFLSFVTISISDLEKPHSSFSFFFLHEVLEWVLFEQASM